MFILVWQFWSICHFIEWMRCRSQTVAPKSSYLATEVTENEEKEETLFSYVPLGSKRQSWLNLVCLQDFSPDGSRTTTSRESRTTTRSLPHAMILIRNLYMGWTHDNPICKLHFNPFQYLNEVLAPGGLLCFQQRHGCVPVRLWFMCCLHGGCTEMCHWPFQSEDNGFVTTRQGMTCARAPTFQRCSNLQLQWMLDRPI